MATKRKTRRWPRSLLMEVRQKLDLLRHNLHVEDGPVEIWDFIADSDDYAGALGGADSDTFIESQWISGWLQGVADGRGTEMQALFKAAKTHADVWPCAKAGCEGCDSTPHGASGVCQKHGAYTANKFNKCPKCTPPCPSTGLLTGNACELKPRHKLPHKGGGTQWNND